MKLFLAGVYWEYTFCDVINSYSRDIEENDGYNILKTSVTYYTLCHLHLSAMNQNFSESEWNLMIL